MAFPHMLKSLFYHRIWSPNLGGKPELLLSQFKRQSNVVDEYENLTIVWCWPNSIKLGESLTAYWIVIDRSQAPSQWSPLSTFLTNRCQPRHNPCDGGIIGNLNLSRGASGQTTHKHHLSTECWSEVFSGFILFILSGDFLLPGSGNDSLWLCGLFANPSSGIWWQCQR